MDEFAAYYREIGDVLEGLGLFNSKTDTAAVVIEVLKTALTILLIPLRALVQVSKAVVDVFIDWYNKSELLRGVIGGLGAVIATTFRAIKDDAIKYLGGVSDIIVGIFTLDKDKIINGFKSALSATADLAMGQGERAAKAFMDGYEANKNNRITRSVSVETTETAAKEGPLVVAKEKPVGESDADLKKRLASLLKQHQAEINAERQHQEMLLNLKETASLANDNQRQQQLKKVELDAQRKALALQTAEQLEALLVTGTQQEKHAKILALEQEKDAAVALVQEEAHQKQLELQAKFTKEDADQVQQDVADQLAAIEAAEVEKEALIQQKFGEALASQQAKSVELYNARYAALEAELALLAMYGGRETAEYRKTRAEQLKLEKDFNKQSADDARKMAQESARCSYWL